MDDYGSDPFEGGALRAVDSLVYKTDGGFVLVPAGFTHFLLVEILLHFTGDAW